MKNETQKNGRASDKLNELVRFLISINALCLACFWFGKSASVFALDDWRGLVVDNVALIIAMASACSLALQTLKPNS